MALFDDAAGRALSRVQPAGLPAFDETRLRRARGLTHQGAFRKAGQALSITPQAPKGEATVSLLQALHPPPTQGPEPDRAHLQSPLPLTAEDIQAGLRSFLKGSAPGASGLRNSHIDGMITSPSPQAAATALETLVSLVNKLASGRASSKFRDMALWCTAYSARNTKWGRSTACCRRGHRSPCFQVSYGPCQTIRSSIAGTSEHDDADEDEEDFNANNQGSAELQSEQAPAADTGRYPRRKRRPPPAWTIAAYSPTSATFDVTTSDEPTLRAAMKASPQEQELCLQAIEEFDALDCKGTWVPDLKSHKQALPTHVILKVKRNADGSVERFKARIVAGGNHQ
jgi:hypothetical protein